MLNVFCDQSAVVDVKPQDLQELNEVISTCHFHPTHCNTLIYGTSRGNIRLVDLRKNALCDKYTLRTSSVVAASCDIVLLQRFCCFAFFFPEMQYHPVPLVQQEQSFFAEIISSVSDVRFLPGERYVCSRDYLSLKVNTSRCT